MTLAESMKEADQLRLELRREREAGKTSLMGDFEELRAECDALRAEHEEVLARVEAAEGLEGEIVKVRVQNVCLEEEL